MPRSPALSAAILLALAAAPALAQTAEVKPGLATGQVLDTAGKPLAGAAVYLEMAAVSGPPRRGKTEASGAYAVKMPAAPLIYRVHAWMPLAYRGKTYCVRIAPETEADKAEVGAQEGGVRNFRWKLSGPVDTAGPDQPSDGAFYGGTLRLLLDFEDGGYDASLDLTFTPDGPLIDGSAGDMLTRHVDLKETVFVYDIPIGAYTVTATRTLRDGTRAPVRLGPDNQHGGESASLVFKPHETSLPCGSATTDNGVDRAFLTVMSP